MGSGITLWVRRGHAESDDAILFLRTHKYAADAVHDLAVRRPSPEELDRLAKGAGGDYWPFVDGKSTTAVQRFPGGAQAAPADAVRVALLQDAALLKAPLLLTPRGALAGFRESKWRDFLDIGRGRN